MSWLETSLDVSCRLSSESACTGRRIFSTAYCSTIGVHRGPHFTRKVCPKWFLRALPKHGTRQPGWWWEGQPPVKKGSSKAKAARASSSYSSSQQGQDSSSQQGQDSSSKLSRDKRSSPTGCTGWKWKQQALQVAALPLFDHLRERGIEKFQTIN